MATPKVKLDEGKGLLTEKNQDKSYEQKAKEAGLRLEQRHGVPVYIGKPAVVRDAKPAPPTTPTAGQRKPEA